MAYEARHGDDGINNRERNDQNNANNVRNAADVAMASGNPYAAAAGGIVKAGDALTGGKASETLGKAITRANEKVPGGEQLQEKMNRLSESGASNTIGKAASLKNRVGNTGGDTPNQVVNKNNTGGEQDGSLPSSRDGEKVSLRNGNTNVGSKSGTDANATDGKKSSSDSDSSSSSLTEETTSEESTSSAGIGGRTGFRFTLGAAAAVATMIFLPILVIFLAFFFISSSVSGIFGEFDDAFGISDVTGEETGDIEFNPSSQEQMDFLERVNQVAIPYQEEGANFDSLNIVAVFHVLKTNEADVDYPKISDGDIQEVIEAMLLDGFYDKDFFRENLIQQIIPRYLPKKTEKEIEIIADEIFTYISDYYDLIGKNVSDDGSSCSVDGGSCSYDIKGYAISGKGNVSENLQVSNLYVRLMQCGTANGVNYGGSFGKSLEGESLAPFEKYILGVSYASLGENAPAEAFKAQTVVARSYILARHADLGGWRSLEKEDGKWILQVASCSQDQIYCDPDKGCSSTSGGQVYSGTSHQGGSFTKPALSQNSPLRSYAASTSGEVLTNSQGYIIYSGYSASEKEKFASLANSGLNYKQILLQVYNQGNRKYGASNITKNSCSNDRQSSTCIASGEYSQWRQTDSVWGSIPMGNSGRTIAQIGCLVTSVATQIARSGVSTNIPNFNPGTFVQFLNKNGGFASGGNFIWRAATKAAPSFQYQGTVSVSGMSKEQKLMKIQELVNQKGVYVVAEVKGNTGQHWVAVTAVSGSTIQMIDPGSKATNMWSQYNWANTSSLAYYRVH